jgi:hypothetical protein
MHGKKKKHPPAFKYHHAEVLKYYEKFFHEFRSHPEVYNQ